MLLFAALGFSDIRGSTCYQHEPYFCGRILAAIKSMLLYISFVTC